ncbi:unnamed protein product [Auanema sp. JU1783]|nr:unnamed protein product [Auanema sp. JU1783]
MNKYKHLYLSGSTRSTPSTSTTAAPVDSTHGFASATTPSSLFDMNIELEKIANTCLTNRDHELLSGDILKHRLARAVNVNLVLEVQEVIGLAELRDVLGFAPLGPWTKYSEPSNEEIAAASTIEVYYTLREPQSEMRSLDSEFFYEKNFPPAIAFMDKRIPAIRTIYRNKFAEIRRSRDSNETIDRKEVDHMIDEFITISLRISDAISAWKPCKLLANQ